MAWATREQIYSALFTLGSSAYAFKSSGRFLKGIPSVGKLAQPSFTQWEYAERDESKIGMPRKLILECYWLVYLRTDSNVIEAPWSTKIDPILDALDMALRPDDGSRRLTLGGLVYSVRKVNKTPKELGDTNEDRQGMAWLPLEVLVP